MATSLTIQAQVNETSSIKNNLAQKVTSTFLVPVWAAYWICAHLMAWVLTFTCIPSILLAQRLYWALPFIPGIFKSRGVVSGLFMRIGFEASYSINFLTRILTLPIRRELPSFYVVGFPKCGTTSLAEHLRRHPAISGLAGLPYHDVLSKESHYFAGVLGPNCSHSSNLYRSFFPTIMHKWWAEVIMGVDKWICFDACPVHACLPYVARRIKEVTPDAKIIIMVRNPVNGVFSAEAMFREIGADLPWKSLSEEISEGGVQEDSRFQIPPSLLNAWKSWESLNPTDALPHDLPRDFYYNLYSHIHCGEYTKMLDPYLQHFPPSQIMFINFDEFVHDTKDIVQKTLDFVGVDRARFEFKELPPGMKSNYRNKHLHPSVKTALTEFYRPSVHALYNLMGKDLGWEGFAVPSSVVPIQPEESDIEKAATKSSVSNISIPEGHLPSFKVEPEAMRASRRDTAMVPAGRLEV